MGNLLAFFIIDHSIKAVEMIKRDVGDKIDIDGLLNKYRTEEDAEYANVRTNLNIREAAGATLNTAPEAISKNPETFFVPDTHLCRTALLPAESRYLGYTTERSTAINPLDYVHEAMKRDDAGRYMPPAGQNTMPLVQGNFHELDACPFKLQLDFRDFFFADERMGWMSLMLPNGMEERAYLKDQSPPRGTIMMCLYLCRLYVPFEMKHFCRCSCYRYHGYRHSPCSYYCSPCRCFRAHTLHVLVSTTSFCCFGFRNAHQD